MGIFVGIHAVGFREMPTILTDSRIRWRIAESKGPSSQPRKQRQETGTNPGELLRDQQRVRGLRRIVDSRRVSGAIRMKRRIASRELLGHIGTQELHANSGTHTRQKWADLATP